MVNNYILRANARKQLGGSIFKNQWLLMLVVCGLAEVIIGGVGSIPYFGAIATLVVTGPLSYGVARTTVRCVEGEKWEIGQLFKGFEEDFGGSFLLGLLQGIFVALWSLLLIVPGIVKSYSYAMAYYLKQEDPNKERDAVDYITESRKIMDGHKWQLFCLDFSFLGWYILGALCLGIGIFFVMPYHEVARANFYEALKAERIMSQPSAIPAMPAGESGESSSDNQAE